MQFLIIIIATIRTVITVILNVFLTS